MEYGQQNWCKQKQQAGPGLVLLKAVFTMGKVEMMCMIGRSNTCSLLHG
jgi:hypothetical protein